MSTFNILLICLLVILLVYLLIHLWKYKRYYYLGFKLPGPPALPIFGNFLSFFGLSHEQRTATVIRLYEENRHYHPIFRVWLGTSLTVFLTDPELIRKILVNNLDKSRVYDLWSGSSGQSIIEQRDISKWRKHRKIVETSFQFSTLKNSIRIFFEDASILANKMATLANSKKSFESNHLVGLALLNSLMRSSFGVDFEVQQNYYSHHPYQEAVESTFEIYMMTITKPWLMIDYIATVCGVKAQVKKNRTVQKNFIKNIIETIRSLIKKEDNNVLEFDDQLCVQTGSFVERVLRDQMNPLKYDSHCMSDTELLHEMVLLMTAGTDTSHFTISVILNILAIHPNIQEDVFNEIEHVLGDKEATPTYDQLQDLNLLTRVIKEAMRLYPAGAIISRSSPTELKCGDYTIPASTTMFIFIYGIHRDPRYWPDPDRFDPDRFLPSEVAKRNPNAYFPFSLGARNCIGSKYAMLQMKTTISTLLRRYRILPGDKCRTMQDIRFDFGITMRPLAGNDIKLESR